MIHNSLNAITSRNQNVFVECFMIFNFLEKKPTTIEMIIMNNAKKNYFHVC